MFPGNQMELFKPIFDPDRTVPKYIVGCAAQDDYTGFPRTVLVYGGDEVMSGETPEYEETFKRCGVQDYEIHIEPHTFHGYPMFTFTPEGRRGERQIIEYLKRGDISMNIARTILDGIVMCVIFNAVVGLFFYVFPQAYSRMFPKSIKIAAVPYVKKRDMKMMYVILTVLYLLMFLYMAVSAHLAGATGFWNLFWTGYIEMMFVNVGDFVLLDVLARLYVKDKGMIKGAEHDPGWEWKEWWKLAVPEHGLAWPLIFCPLVGLIVAGINALIW